MRKIPVEDAVGMVLAHDLTKIVPGEYKGPAFKKGYIICKEDIEELKNIGKNHVFVVSLNEDEVHENEAASLIAAAAAGEGTRVANPSEGKANIRSTVRGFLKINRRALDLVNQNEGLALVSVHNHTVVEADKIVAAAKIIPLTLKKEKVESALATCKQWAPVVEVKPMLPLKTGIIITGSEVYHGRIEDKFGQVFKAKIEHYGGEIIEIQYAPDDMEHIYRLILEMVDKGVQVILISGGMAVDADDVTPQAIRQAATEIITYGVPILPGSMGMLAYRGDIPLFGVPACAMFYKTTVFDLLFPRLLTKEQWSREEIVSMAHGGICWQCEECHYPQCSFGKGN